MPDLFQTEGNCGPGVRSRSIRVIRMIKNERQYEVTRAAIGKFELAIGRLEEKIREGQDGSVRLEYDALRGQRLDLLEEIDEYDGLKSGGVPVPELPDVGGLPGALVRCRIALGLSQKELADRLGLYELQIRRHEDADYGSADLVLLQEISDVLRQEKERRLFRKDADPGRFPACGPV